MAKQKFIKARPSTSSSLDFEFLLKEGVMLAQKFSGNKWTDYNYHDPGFTLLEQLCYALTDLAYRTNFSLEDILLSNKDNFNLEERNLFLPIHKILPTSPITEVDFRKLILDFSSSIKNVFIKPVFNNTMGLHGLYDILVQFDDSVSNPHSKAILEDLKAFLNANRTLCTDFNNVKALQRELITIDARINIDPFTLGETVLANIYNEVNQLLNSNINFYSFEEMLERGYDVNAIYSGPLLKNGFIDEIEFKSKTSEIYVSNIMEIIENIDGVNSIEFFEVYKNGIRQFNNLIDFKEENYPAFDIQIENYDFSSEKIALYRNDNIYEIDRVILSQLYHSFSLSAKSNFKSVVSKGINTTTGRFSKKELEEFYSIQNELPAVYGLRKNELPTGSNAKRRAQVNQLKAYIGFFEQIMADHLSQLANVRNLFSIDKDIKNTYFHQYPDDISDFDSLTPFETKEEYLEFLSTTSESSHSFLERRNRAVNHLMSRFSEVFDDAILIKLLMSIDEEKKDEEVRLEVLGLKLDYAKNILSNGKNKSLGFNYKVNTGTPHAANISGLQARLNLIFGIKSGQDNSLISPLFDSYRKLKKSEVEWSQQTIALKNGIKFKVKAAPQKEYESNQFLFCLDSQEALRQTFLYATQAKSYRVVESSSKAETKFSVLYNAPGLEQPIKLSESKSESECYDNIKAVKSRFKQLNEKCEGFYLLEHILLRPTMVSAYKSLVYAADGTVVMTSVVDDSFEKLQSDCEDLMVLGSNPNNYDVMENGDSYRAFLKDLFGNTLFRLTAEFDSVAHAKQQIVKWSNYLIKQKSKGVLSSDFTEIKINENLSLEFPDDFKYSNTVSFIFPDWPARFQNMEFKRFIQSSIENYIPANLAYNVFFIDINALNLFEERYKKWLGAKKTNNTELIDESSLQLIQLLKSYNASV
jgi:hypothetical protein